MRKFIDDLKVICLILGFSVGYSFILNGEVNLIDIINTLLIITFSIYICSIIIIYKLKEEYISNLHNRIIFGFYYDIKLYPFIYWKLLHTENNGS